ncbi:hypothetical protein [Cupriavidus basilensis]
MSTATEQARERIGRIALGDVVHRSARRFGARTALIEGDHSLSYTALNAATNQFAHYLLAQECAAPSVSACCATTPSA